MHKKENDMFTAGCCILCLSIRKQVVNVVSKVFFDAIVRVYAK